MTDATPIDRSEGLAESAEELIERLDDCLYGWTEIRDGRGNILGSKPTDFGPGSYQYIEAVTAEAASTIRSLSAALEEARGTLRAIFYDEGATGRIKRITRSAIAAASMETLAPMLKAIGGRPAIAHLSDCALHNPPAEPLGLCNCGAASGKHTPGPWSFEPENAEDDGSIYPARIVGGQRQLVVCYLTELTNDAMWESGDDCRSKSANAHLMIAAPELYDALKEACEEIAELRDYANNHGGMCDERRFLRGLAALSRARGEV